MDRQYKLCKHRGDCIRDFECSFGSPLNSPTDSEIDNPKSVCWRYEADEDAPCTMHIISVI
jgi:hypothetical protein